MVLIDYLVIGWTGRMWCRLLQRPTEEARQAEACIAMAHGGRSTARETEDAADFAARMWAVLAGIGFILMMASSYAIGAVNKTHHVPNYVIITPLIFVCLFGLSIAEMITARIRAGYAARHANCASREELQKPMHRGPGVPKTYDFWLMVIAFCIIGILASCTTVTTR